MRLPTRDKLSRVADGDQEVIRFLEQLASQSSGFADGNYGDVTIAGGVITINSGVVGLTKVSPDVLARANQTGTQAIGTVSGLQSLLDSLQTNIALKQDALGVISVAVDFGLSFAAKAQTVVTGQSWVTATSKIVANIITPSGVDPDEMFLLAFRLVISNIIAGVGFTVTLYSDPRARGVYTVNCIGY